METKKSPNADLEKQGGLFFEIGLVVTLSLVLIAFEWTTGKSLSAEEYVLEDQAIEEEIIPITRQQQPPPDKPPEPPRVTEILTIIDDDIEIENELILEDYEIDQDTEIELIEFKINGEEEEEEAEIFFIVEDMPSFNGNGQEGFRKWVSENLKYPGIAAENGISGTVFVEFVVQPDGSVGNVKVVRGVDPSLDKEALRVVKSSPKWTPGKQRGKSVSVGFTFPIRFAFATMVN